MNEYLAARLQAALEPFAGIPPDLLDAIARKGQEHQQALDLVLISDPSLPQTLQRAQRVTQLAGLISIRDAPKCGKRPEAEVPGRFAIRQPAPPRTYAAGASLNSTYPSRPCACGRGLQRHLSKHAKNWQNSSKALPKKAAGEGGRPT